MPQRTLSACYHPSLQVSPKRRIVCQNTCLAVETLIVSISSVKLCWIVDEIICRIIIRKNMDPSELSEILTMMSDKSSSFAPGSLMYRPKWLMTCRRQRMSHCQSFKNAIPPYFESSSYQVSFGWRIDLFEVPKDGQRALFVKSSWQSKHLRIASKLRSLYGEA